MSKKGSVLKEWICDLTWKQQTVLLSALRGCDGKSKEDVSKTITRYYRHLILNNADNGSTFMRVLHESEMSEHFIKLFSDLDSYPIHFVFHLFHGIEIIGYKCSDEIIRKYCNVMYCKFCETIHCKPETEKEMDARLADSL